VKIIDFNQGTKINNQNIEEIIIFIELASGHWYVPGYIIIS